MTEVVTPAAGSLDRRLSAAQRALWSSQRRYPEAPLQNMALLTHIDGPVDAERLTAAFRRVVEASETLRTTITSTAAGDRVLVLTRPPTTTEVIEIDRGEAAAWARARATRPIDTATGVYDSVLLQHDDGTASWYLALHHVATDATSSALVFESTVAAYHGRAIDISDLVTPGDGDPERTPEATSKRRLRAAAFWEARSPAPILDTLYRPVAERTPETHRCPVEGAPVAEIEEALAGPYRMISEDLSWTAFLMTALAVQLHRTSQADRFALGLPIHHRSTPEVQRAVGPLMEVYPVDIAIEPGATYSSLHRDVAKSILQVVGKALPGIGAGAADVSGIVNVIRRGGLGSFGPWTTSTEWIHPGAADPFHLAGVQLTTYASGAPAIHLDLNSAAADAAHRSHAPGHLRSILDSMIGDPDASILDDAMITDRESELVASWGTGRPLPQGRHGFDPSRPRTSGFVLDRLSVALRNNSKVAVTDGDRALTGQELWAAASRVAASLEDVGVGRGDRVGIEMTRSADAVIAILGVLLAGASYVPLDPSHPESRRLDLGRRAGVVGVLTDLDGVDTQSVEPRRPPDLVADDEAYVLFTSGSTGEPKGVPITHGGLADYLAFAAESYLGPHQRRPVAPLFTSLGFDLTVTSLFLPLIAGGTIVVIPDDGVPGLRRLAGTSALTWIKATPSHLELLKRLLPSTHRIKTIVVGGEAFPARLADEIADGRPGLDIFNEYGPTEAVVGCMLHRCRTGLEVGHEVPIGGPAPGVALRVVDEKGNDVPIGVAGELLISSPGLSTGYLGDDPSGSGAFRRSHDRRWYASGDIVRLETDDSARLQAVYLGRTDDQIKLNGVRLEPGEVASAIELHPSIERAVVRLWAPDDDPTARPLLAAWVETRPGVDPSDLRPADLRLFLLPRLAQHQLPVAYAVVDQLAFNANGKLDTTELPSPERVRHDDEAEVADVAETADVVDEAVRAAWGSALSLGEESAPLATSDDFFVLGGDSLAALEMTAGLSEALGVEVSEGLIFSAPTFGDFVSIVGALPVSVGADRLDGPIASVELAPPSPGEAALYFEHRLEPESPRYNIGRRYLVDEAVDAERLRSAAEAVVARHQPLHATHGHGRRLLPPGEALHLSVAELDGLDRLSDELSRVAARALYEAPFDLENGPLVRVGLHRLEEGGSAIAVVMHHISGDAGSLDRFWSDLSRVYDGERLEPLAVSYGEHAQWQRRRDDGGEFWAEMWSDPVITDLGLVAPANPGNDGYLERPASFSATALRAGAGRTPTATALAALTIVLDRQHHPDHDERPARYAIGLTASTREHPSSDPMVGYFLNTLPLVIDVSTAQQSFTDLAANASDVLAAALPHRSHPYAEMVASARRRGAQLPLPGVLLAFEDLAAGQLSGRPVRHEILASGHAIAPATVFVQIRGEQVDLGIEYRGSVLDEARAGLLLDDLDTFIAAVLDDPDTSASAVSLPSETGSVLRGESAADTTPLTADISTMLDSPPATPAVRCGFEELGWAELARRSAVVAELLRLNGVGPGDRVMLSVSRSVELVIGLVAILRIGAVYVPVDPTYPEDRRRRIIDAAGPVAAIVEPGAGSPWLPSITIPPDQAAAPMWDADHVADADDPAYLIFTSGSTGAPKGVSITHGQLAASTRARARVYSEPPGRFLLLSSIGFDSSIVGLFWTLAAGGEIVLPTDDEAHDPDALLRLMDRAAVSHVLMVPTLYRALLGRGADLGHWPATVIVAGEACSPDLVSDHQRLRPEARLVNEYGPSEATVWSTVHVCRRGDDPVPIGRPVPGAWCAVVDADGRPVPTDSVGELLIGGIGVADGYLTGTGPSGDASPFGSSSPLGPGRTYRTGDAVTAIAAGDGSTTLVFTGRIDDQLNVGGVRLEPGDVESVLRSVEGVEAAAVVVNTPQAGGRPLLVAHVETGPDVVTDRLRMAAAESLPAAARPSRYVVHERLPTTVHGKIDRAALGAHRLDTVDTDQAIAVPDDETLTPVQKAVLELFVEHLDRPVTLDDGFFDAGGDSLAALTLALDLEDRLGAEFSVTSLLADPTARAVAARFESDDTGSDLVDWIRRGDETLPVLVLLAPGSGHLLGYEPLVSALDGSVPIVGVRLPGYDGKADPIDRVAAIVDVIEPLLEEALDGRPAVLFGGSSGGLLAWELQHRAERPGRSFAGLVLQDTVHPDWRREQEAIGFVDDVRHRLTEDGPVALAEELFGRGRRRYERWRRLRASKALQQRSGSELPAVVAQRMFAATNRMVSDYRPPDIEGSVLFLAAARTDPGATFERWRPQADGLTLEVFEGDHFGENGITAAKNVAPVAATLQQAFFVS